MQTTAEMPHLTAELAAVTDSLAQHNLFRDETFVPNFDGECSQVLIGTDTVIKTPLVQNDSDLALRNTRFEAAIVQALNKAETESPLEVPRLLLSQTKASPYYNAFTKVQGDVVEYERVRRFSEQEYLDLGRRIGAFIAWMSTAVELEVYDEIFRATRPVIFERADFIRSQAERAGADDMPRALGRLLVDVRDELDRRTDDGSITPTIVGKDDFGIGNLAFRLQGGLHMVRGNFDFGITKPSRPEREFRHFAPFPTVLEAGVDEYEAITGTKLSRELIQFWAVAQTATNYAGCLQAGPKYTAKAASKLVDLKILLPDFSID